MRNMLIVIVLVFSVAGLAACSRLTPPHPVKWYEQQQHAAALKKMLKRCEQYPSDGALSQNHPNCVNANTAQSAIESSPVR
ncbi:EexN family lipoprotein [Metallibacterium scheffleri]